ncbi:MAG: hypothetical protein IPO95_04285 [Rhodanobacteraceae bacterium]|jgi:hypothetical protein|nr:hypothetical protein [Rhodanobacteraceae bacterium]MBL0039975.1 hypothetical protein [Xanthomonadales bacterium]MBP6078430.1 hypothetical protein [Xanthomonadales bacterium]MBP7622917.1 hypothetical protein [Xanthomonadales bacterium]
MLRSVFAVFLALAFGSLHAESLGLQAKLYSPLRNAPPWNGNPSYPAESYFGTQLSVSGSTAAIAEREPFGTLRIRLYERDGNGQWSAQHEILPPADLSSSLQASFGHKYVLDGDRLAVALQANPSNPLIILFEKAGGAWQESARILAQPYIALNGSFGQGGLGLSGDTLAVGSPGAVQGALGVVHVFVRQGATWALQQVVSESDPYPAANFGDSLRLQGDRLVVNRPGAQFQQHVSSGVYVFDRLAGVWGQQAKITVPAGGAAFAGYFGVSLALDGDRLAIPDQEMRDVGGSGYPFDVVRVYERNGNGQWPLVASLDTGAVHQGNPSPTLSIALRDTRLLIGETYLNTDLAAGRTPGIRLFEFGVGGWSDARRIEPYDWATGWGGDSPIDYGVEFGRTIAFDDAGAALVAAHLDAQPRPFSFNVNPPGAVYLLTDSVGLFCDGFEANGPRCDGAPLASPPQ